VKIGDLVVCKRRPRSVGRVVEVWGANCGAAAQCKVIWPNGHTGWWYADDLAPAPPAQQDAPGAEEVIP
jgi:hypothetical protein